MAGLEGTRNYEISNEVDVSKELIGLRDEVNNSKETVITPPKTIQTKTQKEYDTYLIEFAEIQKGLDIYNTYKGKLDDLRKELLKKGDNYLSNADIKKREGLVLEIETYIRSISDNSETIKHLTPRNGMHDDIFNQFSRYKTEELYISRSSKKRSNRELSNINMKQKDRYKKFDQELGTKIAKVMLGNEKKDHYLSLMQFTDRAGWDEDGLDANSNKLQGGSLHYINTQKRILENEFLHSFEVRQDVSYRDELINGNPIGGIIDSATNNLVTTISFLELPKLDPLPTLIPPAKHIEEQEIKEKDNANKKTAYTKNRQKILKDKGLYKGTIDGNRGSGTNKAFVEEIMNPNERIIYVESIDDPQYKLYQDKVNLYKLFIAQTYQGRETKSMQFGAQSKYTFMNSEELIDNELNDYQTQKQFQNQEISRLKNIVDVKNNNGTVSSEDIPYFFASAEDIEVKIEIIENELNFSRWVKNNIKLNNPEAKILYRYSGSTDFWHPEIPIVGSYIDQADAWSLIPPMPNPTVIVRGQAPLSVSTPWGNTPNIPKNALPKGIKTISKNITPEVKKENRVIEINDINFGHGEEFISQKQTGGLKTLAQKMIINENISIRISGHIQPPQGITSIFDGSIKNKQRDDIQNKRIRRAISVKKYLISQGVDEKRININTAPGEFVILPGVADEKQRRVTIQIMNE